MSASLLVGHRQVSPTTKHVDSFWSRVLIGDACWEWFASIDGEGYGRVKMCGVDVGCHRVSWFFEHGDPGAKVVCHRCDNRRCVRPSHLFLGSQLENVLDAKLKGRLWTGNVGVNNRSAKLSEADVVAIRAASAEGATRKALADTYGVSACAISNVATRKKWSHVP